MYVLRDKDGYLFYDGPYGKPLRFGTETEAQTYLESGNWRLDGATVVPEPKLSSCICPFGVLLGNCPEHGHLVPD